jgi:hypothetical protein
MAWYRNFYHCTHCNTSWEDERSRCCDDECPNCGSRNRSPYASEDLTEIIARVGGAFVVSDHRTALTTDQTIRPLPNLLLRRWRSALYVTGS